MIKRTKSTKRYEIRPKLTKRLISRRLKPTDSYFTKFDQNQPKPKKKTRPKTSEIDHKQENLTEFDQICQTNQLWLMQFEYS